MNWYSGSIAEAVALSKSRNAIFVVYVEGNDELSQKLRGFINEEKIKTKLEGDEFVAIRVEGGSTAYMQFAQIYQLVPLPSLFFIGKNGTPLEIATGVISSADELEAKIENVLKLTGLSKEKEERDDVKASGSSTSQSSGVSIASGTSVSLTPLSLSANTSTTSTSPTTSVTEDFISNEQQASVKEKTDPSSNIVCDGDVCYKKVENNKESKEFNEKSETEIAEKVHPNKNLQEEETKQKTENETPQSTSVSTVQEKNNEDDKVEHAKKLLEEKRKEREAEEARLEREREIRRRKEGQEMQNFKKLQKDQELQQLKEKIQRDKLEEQAARQRILEQIAADRAERAQRMNLPPASSTQQPKTGEPSTNQKQASKGEGGVEFARIQFRRQTGESETHNFLTTDQFKIVRDFVKNTLLNGTKVKEFSLATTFPRREFTTEDDIRTLQELDLYPSAVLLVLTPTITSVPAAVVARSGGFVNVFNTVFWGMLSPLFYIFNYVRGFFVRRPPTNNADSGGQKRANSDTTVANEVSKRRNIDRLQNNEVIDDGPSTGMNVRSNKSLPYRRVGNSNIHRLRDQKDSDDENNTWNGNSTQQQ